MDWKPIETAPKDGTRIEVKHERASYGVNPVTAAWTDGRWRCSEAFINPFTMAMYSAPTHWRPTPPSDSA